MKASEPRTFSWISTKISMSAKRRTTPLVSGNPIPSAIAWVWDVYDRDQQRALRLSGQEVGGKTGRDALRNPWGAADDLVLRKIAQAGLSGLTGMISGTPEPAAPATRRGPAVASAGEPASPDRSFAALGYTDN